MRILFWTHDRASYLAALMEDGAAWTSPAGRLGTVARPPAEHRAEACLRASSSFVGTVDRGDLIAERAA